jgi:hypothetical protein
MGRRFGPRIAVIVAVLSIVAGGVGLIASLILNVFVLDEYDAYGEVPVPGSASLHLPAGEMTVSFHTLSTGRPTSGFPIPDMGFSITPPAGVPKPQVTESVGGTTSVNSDVHVQVWTVQVPAEGTYNVETDGKVSGYIDPRLAFGHGSSYGWLWWLFGGLLALGIVELVAALTWSARSARRARPLEPQELLNVNETWEAPRLRAVPSDPPGDQGIRLEQLKQLAALRDSGALSDDEFESEKRRILDN